MKNPRLAASIAILLGFCSCKQPIQIDTSSAPFIPGEIAVEELKELLPTAEVVRCSTPKIVTGPDEIASWTISATEVVFRVEGKDPFRLRFADITAVKLNRLHIYFEVRVFTPLEPREWKEHFRFNWKSEAPARRTAELIEALRSKSPDREEEGRSGK